MTRSHATRAVTACLALALLAPAGAQAHGGGPMAESAEAAIAELSKQPARVLAQQALAGLEILDDVEGAELRLDAALESKDRDDIDITRLEKATETLDGGDPEAALVMLDEALSRPLGADSGKALHKSGRKFTAEAGTPEVAGTAVGGVLLLLGAAGLARGCGGRSAGRPERPSPAPHS